MDRNDLGFGERLGMAFRLIFNGDFARQVQAGLKAIGGKEEKAAHVTTKEDAFPGMKQPSFHGHQHVRWDQLRLQAGHWELRGVNES